MKAYANGLISPQYFFDTNYFHLLLGLRSFQKSEFEKSIEWEDENNWLLKLLFLKTSEAQK